MVSALLCSLSLSFSICDPTRLDMVRWRFLSLLFIASIFDSPWPFFWKMMFLKSRLIQFTKISRGCCSHFCQTWSYLDSVRTTQLSKNNLVQAWIPFPLKNCQTSFETPNKIPKQKSVRNYTQLSKFHLRTNNLELRLVWKHEVYFKTSKSKVCCTMSLSSGTNVQFLVLDISNTSQWQGPTEPVAGGKERELANWVVNKWANGNKRRFLSDQDTFDEDWRLLSFAQYGRGMIILAFVLHHSTGASMVTNIVIRNSVGSSSFRKEHLYRLSCLACQMAEKTHECMYNQRSKRFRRCQTKNGTNIKLYAGSIVCNTRQTIALFLACHVCVAAGDLRSMLLTWSLSL